MQKAPDQSNYSMLVFGDMHLAGGRNKDRQWFSNFCSDVNEYVGAHASDLTLTMRHPFAHMRVGARVLSFN